MILKITFISKISALKLNNSAVIKEVEGKRTEMKLPEDPSRPKPRSLRASTRKNAHYPPKDNHDVVPRNKHCNPPFTLTHGGNNLNAKHAEPLRLCNRVLHGRHIVL